jgi:hypothetical protein
MEKKIVGIGVLAGSLSGLAAFGFARLWEAPVIGRAIQYEERRSAAEAALTGEHAHEHEVFSRTLQENVGAGIGTIVFAIAMGALFAVAFIVATTHLRRRHLTADLRSTAMALAGAGFLSMSLVPFIIYPANPPGVGLSETISDRTGAYLLALGVSVGFAIVAAADGLPPRSARSATWRRWAWPMPSCPTSTRRPARSPTPEETWSFPGFPPTCSPTSGCTRSAPKRSCGSSSAHPLPYWSRVQRLRCPLRSPRT